MADRPPPPEPTGAARRLLTVGEHEVLDLVSDVAVRFRALPVCHSAELQEVVFHVHSLQVLVMARAAVRAYPTRFTHEEGFLDG